MSAGFDTGQISASNPFEVDVDDDFLRFLWADWTALGSIPRSDYAWAVSSEKADHPADYIIRPERHLYWEGGGHIWISNDATKLAEFDPTHQLSIDEQGVGTTTVTLTQGHYVTCREWAEQLTVDIAASGVTGTYVAHYDDEYSTAGPPPGFTAADQPTYRFWLEETTSQNFLLPTSQPTNIDRILMIDTTQSYAQEQVGDRPCFHSEEYVLIKLRSPFAETGPRFDNIRYFIRWVALIDQACYGMTGGPEKSTFTTGDHPVKTSVILYGSPAASGGPDTPSATGGALWNWDASGGDRQFDILDSSHEGLYGGMDAGLYARMPHAARHVITDMGRIAVVEKSNTKPFVEAVDPAATYADNYLLLRFAHGSVRPARLGKLFVGPGWCFSQSMNVGYGYGAANRAVLGKHNLSHWFKRVGRTADIAIGPGTDSSDHLGLDYMVRGISQTATVAKDNSDPAAVRERMIPASSSAWPTSGRHLYMAYLNPFYAQKFQASPAGDADPSWLHQDTRYAAGLMWGVLLPDVPKHANVEGERWTARMKFLEERW